MEVIMKGNIWECPECGWDNPSNFSVCSRCFYNRNKEVTMLKEEIRWNLKTEFKGHLKFLEMTQHELELHSQKNADYATGGDSLGNFKRVADIFSNYPNLDLSKPAVVALVYMMKQLDAALWMLSQGYEGKIETIDTRLTDVHVYTKIARILHGEDSE